MRAEVESLLASHDSAKSFMETPAVAKVADVIEGKTKKLEEGRCFGHYEIIKQIGEGGMGEVYLDRIRRKPEFTQFLAEMKAQNEGYRRELGATNSPG